MFPKKIKNVNEEIADLKKEIDTLKLAKKEAHEEFDRLHVSKSYNRNRKLCFNV